MSERPPRALHGTIGVDFVDVELDTPSKATAIAGLPAPSIVGNPEGDCTSGASLEVEPWHPEELNEVAAARRVSIVSLVASLVLAFLGFYIGFSENVLSVIGFGMEATLDGISSALVLWRFKRGKQREFADSQAAAQAKEARDARRERNSSIGIGWTFVASAVLLFCSAAWKVLDWDPTTPEHIIQEHDGAVYTAALAWPSSVIFGSLAVWKFRLSRSLNSQVLRKDALCSVLGAVLALICAAAALVEQLAESNPKAIAGVDATASSSIAFILLVEGVRTLKHNLMDWQTEHRELD